MNKELEHLNRHVNIYSTDRDMVRAKKLYDVNKNRISARQVNNTARLYELELDIPDGNYTETVTVEVINDHVSHFFCTCYKGDAYSLCHHMLEAYFYLMDNSSLMENNYFKYSFKRLSELFSIDEKVSVQKQLQMEVYIDVQGSYNKNFEVNLKIGDKKLYALKNKMKGFLDSYVSDGHVGFKLGKELTYSNDKYRFTKEDEQIIDFFESKYHSGYIQAYAISMLDNRELKRFIDILKDKPFYFTVGNMSYKVDRIYDDFSIDSNLVETDDDSYKFFFNFDNLVNITNDLEYVLINSNLYHLNYNQRKLLKSFLDNTGGNPITFKKEELPIFTSRFLPKIKTLSKDIKVPEELEDVIQIESPISRIYFDYKRGKLTAEVKYLYKKQNQEIPRYSKIPLTRDYEVEKRAYEYLEDNDFTYLDKKDMFVIDDIDKQGLFLETKLPNIPEGFEFFASNAVKKLDVIKTPSISSGISLGADSFLECNFDFDGLSVDDFKEVMSSIKENKKYSKLKNGTIIKLDKTEELEDFYSLLEDFDIDYKKLDDLNFKIPKYKALYLNNYVEKENYITVNKSDAFVEFLNKFNEYKNSKIEVIDDKDKLLRDYQVTGVNFLTSLAKCGFGGILADEMGLGKTFQTITYIKHRLHEDSSLKFLVVVPTSLLYNWKAEFEKYAPNVSIQLMNMLPSVRKEMFNKLDKSVIITSYGLLRQDIEEYMSINFDTCIIDEAQNIKNVHAGTTKALKLVNANTKFALTGTPIENSLLELYSIFDFLMPGYFSTLNKFNERFQKPIIKEESKERLEQLNMAVAPFILRRKKVDVAKDLPEKLDKKIVIDLTEEQKKVYYAHLELAKKEIQEEMNINGFSKSQIKILSILTRLRQICIDPSLFVDNYNGGSSKIDAVVEFLQSAISEGHKILLFSQFTSALHILENRFHDNGISYYYIDGGTKAKDRLKMVDDFNQDDTNVFLISLKAGGTGLNLTGADIVVHLDFWWNPAVENQATDRAHRIGQKKIVEVVKFVCQGTIEERILELQDRKKKLSDGILEHEDRDKVILSKLTEKDIKRLLDM